MLRAITPKKRLCECAFHSANFAIALERFGDAAYRRNREKTVESIHSMYLHQKGVEDKCRITIPTENIDEAWEESGMERIDWGKMKRLYELIYVQFFAAIQKCERLRLR